MNTGLLNLLLFVPFLLVALITGLIYFRSGYKRGLWRALISLGATFVAVLVSLGLANLVAGWLKHPVANLIPKEVTASMGVLKGLANSVIVGMVQDVLSMFLFGLFFILCLIVLKIVANCIQPEKLKVEKKAFKWAGLGVRAVDTVVVTLLILLPLYGTMATYITPAAKIASMTLGKNAPAVQVMNKISKHPFVSMYKGGPTRWVYGGLSGFTVGEAQIDLPKVADTIDTTMVKLEKFNAAKGDDRVTACKELTEYLRGNVVEEDWFYEVAKEATVELEKQLQNATTPAEEKEAQLYLAMFSAPEEEFKENGTKMLDFMSYAMDSEFMDFVETDDYEILTEEFHEELGEVLNHSTQSVSIKKMILLSDAEQLFNLCPPPIQPRSQGFSAKDAANDFIDAHWKEDGFVDEEDRQRESEAFMILYFENNPLALLEGFARHPLFGYNAVEQFVNAEFMVQTLGNGMNDDVIRKDFASEGELCTRIRTRLQACEHEPLSKNLLNDYAKDVVIKKED